VVVFPEVEDVEVELDPQDLRIDRFCSSGPGGQSVNTTYSAIRITHIPTGLVVSCQDEKSQQKNKTAALKVLRARIYRKMEEEREAELSRQRKAQVKSGDRSDKIRTYNFPQSRVTDHRIGLTLHRLEAILNGELDELVDHLQKWDREQRLERSSKFKV
jgi:peptide chain release factor 1